MLAGETPMRHNQGDTLPLAHLPYSDLLRPTDSENYVKRLLSIAALLLAILTSGVVRAEVGKPLKCKSFIKAALLLFRKRHQQKVLEVPMP